MHRIVFKESLFKLLSYRTCRSEETRRRIAITAKLALSLRAEAMNPHPVIPSVAEESVPLGDPHPVIPSVVEESVFLVICHYFKLSHEDNPFFSAGKEAKPPIKNQADSSF